jgi:hypothetical protein
MSTDAGSPISAVPPSVPLLPHIRGLRIRRIGFEAPQHAHFTSRLTDRRTAVEFLVETDGPVPARNYGPALFVGDVEVNQSERLDETTWRLVALDPDQLSSGAPISWGWMKDPETVRQPTEYRYEASDESGTGARSGVT